MRSAFEKLGGGHIRHSVFQENHAERLRNTFGTAHRGTDHTAASAAGNSFRFKPRLLKRLHRRKRGEDAQVTHGTPEQAGNFLFRGIAEHNRSSGRKSAVEIQSPLLHAPDCRPAVQKILKQFRTRHAERRHNACPRNDDPSPIHEFNPGIFL